MDRRKEKDDCLYRDKLNGKAKARYLEKIKPLKGLDPLEHMEWTSNFSLLPNFIHAHIYNYMILGVSAYTHEIFSNVRSLQQAQEQFTNRWVQDLENLQSGPENRRTHQGKLHGIDSKLAVQDF